LNRIFDRVDPFLKDDLLRGMFELLVGQRRCAIVQWPPPL
jgi:hypothetical protein